MATKKQALPPIREDRDVSIAVDYATDAVKHLNAAAWWDAAVHLKNARHSAEKLLATIKAAQHTYRNQ